MRNIALCALLATGCTQTDSNDVLTSGMYGALNATTSGEGMTHVNATLYLGNPLNLNFINLGPGDELIATHAGQRHVMTETQLLNVVGYHAQFQGDEEGLEFGIALVRQVDGGAPNSRATLPAKFTIDPAPASASRAAPLTLTWGPAQTLDVMRWEARGDCIQDVTDAIMGDPGTVTIAANRMQKRMGDMIADSCEVTITITRSRLGQLDPGYGKGGQVQGQQVRSVKLTSTP